MSPIASSAFGSTFSRRPLRGRRARARRPRGRRARRSECEPMNPAPPVTIAFTAAMLGLLSAEPIAYLKGSLPQSARDRAPAPGPHPARARTAAALAAGLVLSSRDDSQAAAPEQARRATTVENAAATTERQVRRRRSSRPRSRVSSTTSGRRDRTVRISAESYIADRRRDGPRPDRPARSAASVRSRR